MTPPPDDAPIPGIEDVDAGHAWLRLTFRPLRWREGESSVTRRVRFLLKYALRALRLKCVIVEVVYRPGPRSPDVARDGGK